MNSIQVNLQENLLKSFLVSLFLSSLRNTVPSELHPTYILSSQNMEFLRVPLGKLFPLHLISHSPNPTPEIGMENKHIGYTYLIDENLKVRWAGCGFARPEEADALSNCARILLERMNPPSSSQKSESEAE